MSDKNNSAGPGNGTTRREAMIGAAIAVGGVALGGIAVTGGAMGSAATPAGQSPVATGVKQNPAAVVPSQSSSAGAGGDVSHTAEAIHQEVVFKASRKRVYEALTQTKQFDK